ncbi:general stress protein [Alienimonas sp. DA493]|uniref:general stress protein n=1 Tax=Alienimonas sp. DA493 TaxID=3373605 RepID=UPI0037541B9A
MSTGVPAQSTPDTTSAPLAPQRVVGSYADYAAAQKAVDYLSDEKFPVRHVTIVGRGLKFVEQITGRLNWGRAFLNGLASGALTGLFIGLILAIFFPAVEVVDGVLVREGLNWPLILWATAIGAVFGSVFSLIGYAMTGGKRDFTSVGAMRAETYDVLVDAEHADEAERVLAGMSP